VNTFHLHQRLVDDHAEYARSVVAIRDGRVAPGVGHELGAGPLAAQWRLRSFGLTAKPA
jgi:hypothetical protein